MDTETGRPETENPICSEERYAKTAEKIYNSYGNHTSMLGYSTKANPMDTWVILSRARKTRFGKTLTNFDA